MLGEGHSPFLTIFVRLLLVRPLHQFLISATHMMLPDRFFVIFLWFGFSFAGCVSRVNAEPPLMSERAKWIEIEFTSNWFDLPPLTVEVKSAITDYLESVGWKTYDSSSEGGCVIPGLSTIDVGGYGWLRDGHRVVASILLDERFIPVFAVRGEGTPEFKAMIAALKLFRKEHPFPHSDLWKAREKEKKLHRDYYK